ncbi:hypothetical protein T484DRAFT_1840275, partial [Baffinella frigidus]
ISVLSHELSTLKSKTDTSASGEGAARGEGGKEVERLERELRAEKASAEENRRLKEAAEDVREGLEAQCKALKDKTGGEEAREGLEAQCKALKDKTGAEEVREGLEAQCKAFKDKTAADAALVEAERGREESRAAADAALVEAERAREESRQRAAR